MSTMWTGLLLEGAALRLVAYTHHLGDLIFQNVVLSLKARKLMLSTFYE